jgi:hypothetical protein
VLHRSTRLAFPPATSLPATMNTLRESKSHHIRLRLKLVTRTHHKMLLGAIVGSTVSYSSIMHMILLYIMLPL